MTKAQQYKRMIDNAIERAKWLGATGEGDDVNNKLNFPTKQGNLKIWFDPDDIPQLIKTYGVVITAFCCFDDPAALKALGLEGNHHSGKWNWHCMDKSGIDAFISCLERIAA